MTRSSVLLTCAGLRVDVVRAFREALDGLGWDGDVVAVDANPLSPALMMAEPGETLQIPLLSTLNVTVCELPKLLGAPFESLSVAVTLVVCAEPAGNSV